MKCIRLYAFGHDNKLTIQFYYDNCYCLLLVALCAGTTYMMQNQQPEILSHSFTHSGYGVDVCIVHCMLCGAVQRNETE